MLALSSPPGGAGAPVAPYLAGALGDPDRMGGLGEVHALLVWQTHALLAPRRAHRLPRRIFDAVERPTAFPATVLVSAAPGHLTLLAVGQVLQQSLELAVILAALRKATDGERLMLRLGAECGLRRLEIAKVHSRDVMRDLVGWSLVVVGKGDKQRIVPIGDDLALLIRSAHGYCFPGRWSRHVESSYIGRRLSTLLGDGWTAHSLRHRYATTTYAATRDPLLVSKLLGHASVETTQRYIAMPDDRLRAAVEATRLAA